MTAINPNAVADEIIGNCEAYDAGVITRTRWDAEQQRLWKMAADACLTSVVLALVFRTSASGPAQHKRVIDIVFDGPPSHESGRFVEVESPAGTSIKFGEWVKRDDGYWALRFDMPRAVPGTDAKPAAS